MKSRGVRYKYCFTYKVSTHFHLPAISIVTIMDYSKPDVLHPILGLQTIAYRGELNGQLTAPERSSLLCHTYAVASAR